MIEEVTKMITAEVINKRIDFTEKVVEFAKSQRHILHPDDYYDSQGFVSCDLDSYRFREIESFVPDLAVKEVRTISRMLHEQYLKESKSPEKKEA